MSEKTDSISKHWSALVGIRKNWFSQTFEIRTALSPTEAANALQREVESGNWFRNLISFKFFRGTITEQGFKIRQTFHRQILIAIGNISQQLEGGSLIQIEIYPRRTDIVGWCIMPVGMIAWLIYGISYAIAHDDPATLAIVLFGAIAFSIFGLLLVATYDSQRRKILERLFTIFKAEPPDGSKA